MIPKLPFKTNALNQYNFLFWLEWIALWSFASAWLAKGRTMIADITIDMMASASQMLLDRDKSEPAPITKSGGGVDSERL